MPRRGKTCEWKRKPINRRKTHGSAIIEMIAIIPLMILFMLFTIIVCRWLVYQGRILAAGRTASWLVAYADETSGADGIVQSTGFAEDLRRWHFITGGPNAGVVMVRAPVRAGGLLATKNIEDIMGSMQQTGSEIQKTKNDKKQGYENTAVIDFQKAGYESNVALSRKKEKDKTEEVNSTMAKGGGIVTDFISGVVQFLTDDFKRVEVKVDYWMPLPFNLGAFERLLGAPVDRGGPAPPGTSQAFAAMAPNAGGRSFALLTRGTHTTCILPILDPGRSGGVAEALEGAIQQAKSLLEDLKDSIKDSTDQTLYRPMEKFGDGNSDPSVDDHENIDNSDKVNQPAFYALLVYEINDPEHKSARP